MKIHTYQTHLDWTGNTGKGTESYRAYERAHRLSAGDKPAILASSDPSFRGDKTRYNPEELFLASLSSCHMLWFLHFCSTAGVIVLEYSDAATGQMTESDDGNGWFTDVLLKPSVIVKEEWMIEKTAAIHDQAHHYCFISNSCNFPVRHQPVCGIPVPA